MADLNVGGPTGDLVVTKQADGTLTWKATLPGVINGQPENSGGSLDAAAIQSNISNARNEISFNQSFIRDKQAELNKFLQNPKSSGVDPANYDWYQNDLQENINVAQVRINAQQTSLEFNQFLSSQTASITSQLAAQETATTAQDTEPPSATNPSGVTPKPYTEANEDGSTTTYYEDGSTLTENTDGTTSATDAPASGTTAEEDPTNQYTPTDDEKGTDEIDASAETGASASDDTSSYGEENERPDVEKRTSVPRGAMPATPPASQAQWAEAKDLRVKLRVPNEYLTGKASGPSNILQKNGGILFPYTPQISVENTANYSAQNPLHSNYPLYFYKNSSISPINVTAKFTVQNEFEGAVLLSIIHMLRALTKMKFGNDPDAGAPPPVCRFDAYGDYMLYNVPVSIASWRHELPDGVDYISVGRKGSPTTFGHSMVPTMSTISLTLNPMYSRREMLEYNTKNWLSGSLERRGYL